MLKMMTQDVMFVICNVIVCSGFTSILGVDGITCLHGAGWIEPLLLRFSLSKKKFQNVAVL